MATVHMFSGFPNTEVQIIAVHNENSVQEISLYSFTKFLSYTWEQSFLHLFYVISPCTHLKIFNIFYSLGNGSKGYDWKEETLCKCWYTVSWLFFVSNKSPMKMQNPSGC